MTDLHHSCIPRFATAVLLIAAHISAPLVLTAAAPHPAVFISEATIAALQQARVHPDEATRPLFADVERQAGQWLTESPRAPARWYVPGYYVDPDGHRANKGVLAADANSAYGLALMYRIHGDEMYAAAAVRRIEAWTHLTELSRQDDSTLSFTYHFPAMIFAADLLRGWSGWSDASQENFARFLKEQAMPMNTMGRANNWGSWGLVLWVAGAAYLDDESALAIGVGRFKDFIAEQIAEDGHFPLEVTRNNGVGERGLWYTHFSLMPLTLAAEILDQRGVNLFEYRSPNGRSLRLAYERVVPWTVHPETFPFFKPRTAEERQIEFDYVGYWEILNARWPNPQATDLLRQRRPLVTTHTAPFLSLTHGPAVTRR